MNILFLTTQVDTGGITSYILTLGGALAKSGNKVLVVSGGGDCVPLLEAAGMRHIQLNIRVKSEVHPKLLLSLPALIRLVGKEDIHIIHAQTRVTQVQGSWLSFITGIKMITTCHGFFRPRWFRKTFPCWGAAVIAISKPVVQHLINDFNISSQKIHLIPNGIDLDRFVLSTQQQRQEVRKKWGINAAFIIGIIARLSDVKGIDILIKAMPDIIKEIPSVSLMIVGQGPQEDHLKKISRELSLTGHVHFKDTINQTQDYLPGFDVFVMPSIMEGLGLSVMEAQASGIPVVASRVGGLVDLIEDGESGYLVCVNDPAALAERIVKVLLDPQRSSQMAQNARGNIERHFSSERMFKQTFKIYEQYSRR